MRTLSIQSVGVSGLTVADYRTFLSGNPLAELPRIPKTFNAAIELLGYAGGMISNIFSLAGAHKALPNWQSERATTFKAMVAF